MVTAEVGKREPFSTNISPVDNRFRQEAHLPNIWATTTHLLYCGTVVIVHTMAYTPHIESDIAHFSLAHIAWFKKFVHSPVFQVCEGVM